MSARRVSRRWKNRQCRSVHSIMGATEKRFSLYFNTLCHHRKVTDRKHASHVHRRTHMIVSRDAEAKRYAQKTRFYVNSRRATARKTALLQCDDRRLVQVRTAWRPAL